MSSFIETVLENYLEAYFKEKLPLSKFLRIDSEQYNQLMEKIGKEFIYWTARQPGEMVDYDPQIYYGEGYMNHRSRYGFLDLDLYPLQENSPSTGIHGFMEGGKVSLGHFNCAMPLLNLTEMLTVFCTELTQKTHTL